MHIEPTTLLGMFERNDHFLKRHWEAFDDQSSLLCPLPERSNAHWILGHLIETLHQYLQEWQCEGVLPEDQRLRFRAGEKASGSDTVLSWSDLKGLWNQTRLIFMIELQKWPPERFQDEVRPGVSWVKALEFTVWHEGYHIGQLALLKPLS